MTAHKAFRVLLMFYVMVVAFSLPSRDFTFLETESETTVPTVGLGALNLTALVVNSGPARESRIVLGTAENAFTVALTSDGSFVIRHQGQSSFTVGPDGEVSVNGKIKVTGVARVDETLNFLGVDQWMLAAAEQYNQGAVGWTNSTTSECGNPNKKILGGYGKFAGGEVTKLFRQLPEHTQIRVKATFHFIDAWTGETAFAKLDHQLVWTDMHDHMTSKNGINICGSASSAEGKFAVPIDVTIPHTSSALTVSFGSTLTASALEASWGVSDVQILVRKSTA
jgi:hypothetical protein